MNQKIKKDVRHGCPDCISWEKPCNKEPCKSCDYYSNWVDKREATANA